MLLQLPSQALFPERTATVQLHRTAGKICAGKVNILFPLPEETLSCHQASPLSPNCSHGARKQPATEDNGHTGQLPGDRMGLYESDAEKEKNMFSPPSFGK